MKFLSLLSLNIVTLAITPTEIDPSHGIYAQTMIVCDTYVDTKGTETIEDDGGEIHLTDGNGNLWVYEEYPEDYYVGDYVAVLFEDNGTPNYIYDDIILDLRATGFAQ